MAALPCCGTSVAKPRPRITVPGRLTDYRLVEVVDAGREDQVLAQGQGGGDSHGRRGRAGHEELRHGDRLAGFGAARPGRPGRVVLDRGHEDVVTAAASRWTGTAPPRSPDSMAGRCSARTGPLNRRRERPGPRRRPCSTGPLRDPFAPPMSLLRTMYCWLPKKSRFAADLAVGDEAAAGVVLGRAVVLEEEAAVDDGAPDRVGLRCRPDLGPCCRSRRGSRPGPVARGRRCCLGLSTLIVRFDSDRQKLSSELQSRGRRRCTGLLNTSMAPLITVSWASAETGDLGVVSDLEHQRVDGRSVGARARRRSA